jgi:hypothetical protein
VVYLIWALAGVHCGCYAVLYPELSTGEREVGVAFTVALFAVACLVTFI